MDAKTNTVYNLNGIFSVYNSDFRRMRTQPKGVMADAQPPCYEDVVNHHELSSEQMLVKVPEKALSPIAKEMTGWRNIELGLPSGKVTGVKTGNGSDDEEKRREYLRCWWQTFGHRATFEALACRFLESGRCDLADLVCEQLKKSLQDSSEPPPVNQATGEKQPPNTSAPPAPSASSQNTKITVRSALAGHQTSDNTGLQLLASKVDELVQEQRKRDAEIADLRQSLARKGEELKADREMLLKEVSEKICLLEQNLKHEVSSEEKTTLINCLSWANRHMKANHQRNATIIISLVVFVTMCVLFYY